MNKLSRRTSLAWLVAASLSTTLAACGGGDEAPSLIVGDGGVSSFDPAALATNLSTYPLETPLSTAERASLAFMREEEMLAHAVYQASAALWPTEPVFANIATSEATHTAAVKALLDRYALPDPLAGLPVTRFPTPAFQTLYTDLAATSARSLIDALIVGVQIEELDIRDIQVQKDGIDNADILYVYDNLLRGSRNHLRAFMKVLTRLGGGYTPQYISQVDFDAILAGATESGR